MGGPRERAASTPRVHERSTPTPARAAGRYAHDVEDVLTAYIPFLTGILLTGAHFHFIFCWFFCKLTETYESHSGYCFAGSWPHWFGLTNSTPAAHHDFHHTRNQVGRPRS